MVKVLNESDLPPLPTTRQCPTHYLWVPTHTSKEYDQLGGIGIIVYAV